MALVGIQTGLLLDFTLKLRGFIDHKRELTAVENDRLVVHIDSGQYVDDKTSLTSLTDKFSRKKVPV